MNKSLLFYYIFSKSRYIHIYIHTLPLGIEPSSSTYTFRIVSFSKNMEQSLHGVICIQNQESGNWSLEVSINYTNLVYSCFKTIDAK